MPFYVVSQLQPRPLAGMKRQYACLLAAYYEASQCMEPSGFLKYAVQTLS